MEYNQKDWAGAEASLRRALDLVPGNSTAMHLVTACPMREHRLSGRKGRFVASSCWSRPRSLWLSPFLMICDIDEEVSLWNITLLRRRCAMADACARLD